MDALVRMFFGRKMCMNKVTQECPGVGRGCVVCAIQEPHRFTILWRPGYSKRAKLCNEVWEEINQKQTIVDQAGLTFCYSSVCNISLLGIGGLMTCRPNDFQECDMLNKYLLPI